MEEKKIINDEYNWDLEDILSGDTLENLFDKWVSLNEQLIKMVDTFTSSLTTFKKWETIGDELEIVENKLMNYVSNKLSENVGDEKFQAWEQKIDMKAHEFHQHFSGLTNKIIKDEKKIRKYLKDPELMKYTRAYEQTFKYKPHILTDEQAMAISKISINNGAVGSIFTTLVDKDIKFSPAKDKKGIKHPIPTASEAFKLLKDKDRELRKNAWISFNKAYYNFESTLTQTLYYNYLKLNTFSKLHNFTDYIDSTCFNDEIDRSFIETLYKHVLKFATSNSIYIKKKQKYLKKITGLDKIKPWDMRLELSKDQQKYTVEEMKQIVLEGLSVLGPEYCEHLKTAMNDKWVSYLPKENKHNGAYSIGGAKGLNKYYILMNFDESYDSVSTLAHELGHSMNSLYFCKAQDVYCDTTIFTAEVPSILNETLLALYMIEKYKDDKKKSRCFKDELLSNFFNTVNRQIIFSKFEWESNKLINEGKPFTKEVITDLYRNISRQYSLSKEELRKKPKPRKEPYLFGESTIFRIGHFYHGNFYVYKYAIGQITAICLASKILNKEPGIMNRFFEFLKSGTSKSPLETIKILGIDLTTEQPYKETFEFIKKLLSTY